MQKKTYADLPQKYVVLIKPRSIKKTCPPPHFIWYRYARLIKIGSIAPARLLYKTVRNRKLIFGGRWDCRASSIDQHRFYHIINDIYQNRDNLENSNTFKDALEKIERNGFYRHKKRIISCEADLANYLDRYLKRLVMSISNEGFKYNEHYSDLPAGGISRHGELMLMHNGMHRLAAAQITRPGTLFPLRISAVHKKQVKNRDLKEAVNRVANAHGGTLSNRRAPTDDTK